MTDAENGESHSVEQMLTLHEIVAAAQRNLARDRWDYLAGASETETTARRNRLALDSLALRPRVLTDVSEIDTAGKLLGHELRLPVVLAPIGSSQLFDPQGAAGVAKAAEDFGTLQFVSSHSEPEFEEVARAAAGPKIFQLYLLGDEDWMNRHIERAIEAGYVGFCLTVDTQVPSRRERDWIKRWSIPSSKKIAGGLSIGFQAKMTWQLVERYKKRYDLPLVIKGIARPSDARRACDLGVDVIYVTNHGGRQLDHALAGADMLPDIADAVAGQAELVADGGILRGTDVIKMIALGADAVGIGRLYCLGMAAGGPAGVVRTLEILRHEIKIDLALVGASSFAELDRSFVCASPAAPLRAPETHLARAFPFLEFERTRF